MSELHYPASVAFPRHKWSASDILLFLDRMLSSVIPFNLGTQAGFSRRTGPLRNSSVMMQMLSETAQENSSLCFCLESLGKAQAKGWSRSLTSYHWTQPALETRETIIATRLKTSSRYSQFGCHNRLPTPRCWTQNPFP